MSAMAFRASAATRQSAFDPGRGDPGAERLRQNEADRRRERARSSACASGDTMSGDSESIDRLGIADGVPADHCAPGFFRLRRAAAKDLA